MAPTATPTPAPTPTPAATATPVAAQPNGGVISLLAGGSQGLNHGNGASAQFSLPNGVAVDRDGTIYVADTGNNAIRKITAAGDVTLLAGGIQGFTEGQGGAAAFREPAGLAVDDAGNVFVADKGNHSIRKITAAGIVTTLAGNGTAGKAGGSGTSARFSSPNAITIDRSGNLFVADTGNQRICKVTSNGATTVVAGGDGGGFEDGTGPAARFIAPLSLTVDGLGVIYVMDSSFLRRITANGEVTSPGLGGGLTLNTPNLTTDKTGDGSALYVADAGIHQLFSITRSGGGTLTLERLAGSVAGTSGNTEGTGGAARFFGPTGIAVDAQGTLFVADANNHRIRKSR